MATASLSQKILYGQLKKLGVLVSTELKCIEYVYEEDGGKKVIYVKYNLGITYDDLKLRDCIEFKDAVFLFRFVVPTNFPKTTLEGYAMTPNGVIETETKYCLEFGNYHSSDQTKAGNNIISNITKTLECIVGWRTTGKGIGLVYGSIDTDDQCKLIAELSKNSAKYNTEKLSTILDKFKKK
jgi:hypothetical protein